MVDLSFDIHDVVRVRRGHEDFQDHITEISIYPARGTVEYYFHDHDDGAADEQLEMVEKAWTFSVVPTPRYRVGQVICFDHEFADHNPLYYEVREVQILLRDGSGAVRYYCHGFDDWADESKVRYAMEPACKR